MLSLRPAYTHVNSMIGMANLYNCRIWGTRLDAISKAITWEAHVGAGLFQGPLTGINAVKGHLT